jgi:hypothetical protein
LLHQAISREKEKGIYGWQEMWKMRRGEMLKKAVSA